MVFCNVIDNITIELEYKGHNPYFNRWFSAITLSNIKENCLICHNPYFNRWFSAME